MIKISTKEELDKFISGNVNMLVIVKFGAEWCGPCRSIEKTIETIDNNNVVFGNVDVDSFEGSLEEYNISSIPVLVFFKDGMIIDKTVGSMSKSQLENKIKSNIDK